MISVSIMSGTKYSSSVSCGIANSSEPGFCCGLKFLSQIIGLLLNIFTRKSCASGASFPIRSDLIDHRVAEVSAGASLSDFVKVALFSCYLSQWREGAHGFSAAKHT
jgi:hypothetical protein